MKKLKIAIVGGHPSPALAVIDQIMVSRPEWTICFFGAKHSLTNDKAVSYEYKETHQRKLPFYNITTGKFKSYSLIITPIGIMQSLFWLILLHPSAILTFGGYIGVPVALAAKFLRIPIFTHIQTLKTSKADRIISRLATKVFLSWPQTKHTIDARKVILTGLPLRQKLLRVRKPKYITDYKRSKKPLLYITGGSQGAHPINKIVGSQLNNLLKHFYIIHQTGESTKYKDLSRLKKLRQPGYIPLAHISGEDIGWVLKHADLIVSRAGMNSICEFLYLNKRAILIPLPMYNDEQDRNAKLYASSGLGRVILQEQATAHKFLKTLLGLNSDIIKNRLQVRRVKGQELQSPEAAKKILDEIEKVIKKN